MNLSPITCDLTPLVESIPKGVSKIFDLFFGKKIEKRKALYRLMEAQAERQARLISEGKANLDKNGNFIDFERQQSDNINQCIEYAVSSAVFKSKDCEPSNDEVSQTFFNQWREYAKNIGEDDLKIFWGKILAEEVYTPNSISLRVLNTLSMISLKEAEFFSSTLKYIIFDRYLALDFIPDNLKHGILDSLYNMGAIAHIPISGIKSFSSIQEYNKDHLHYYYFYHQQNNYCFAFHVDKEDSNAELNFELIELTSVGETLYKLAHSVNEELSINLFTTICNDLELPNTKSLSLYKLENRSITKEILSKTL
ncbi:hypothetical protein CEP48_08575 [Mergibacter septicus]|uniref:Uncharacterized protein n=1 Tax=Mergibacter septicus TaxID=221402 RepID=A0A8D4J3G8_9PAST|nr:DUF2806 domain-containing protein [Mergibacter septicus]AWX16215.1 hypothetical protein CEP47_08570 [Mergibacter septicus]QDJ15467.1 hypothetical protein CEP48_08575 [Mergibacter septicus]UTU48663.1 DUF2806 domain-containing protein [Mergibacter septicus]WMR95707.1 DUF2806 domain-containing protein [Mergibacter septicus]